MQHVEFFDRDHFEYNYHRRTAIEPLDTYIDFFWETRFDHLWQQHESFADVLFPNVGYTYIIKFTISPVLLEKNVDFSEYLNATSSLAYLINPETLKAIKNAESFNDRVAIVTAYYRKLIHQHEAAAVQVKMVKNILAEIKATGNWNKPVSAIAMQHGVDIRTLQRYFELTTSVSTKQAIQLLKIRRAIASLIESPQSFYIEAFGFYDRSHFYKQMNAFFDGHPAFDRAKYLPLLHRSPVKIRY